MQSFVLNLKDSKERLDAFYEGFPNSLERPKVWIAKPPEECTPPDWWHGSPEFWSHTENFCDVLEFIKKKKKPVFFFEDDCIFAEDFDAKFEQFMKEVPQDYDLLNLCTLHMCTGMYTPTQVSDNVLRAKLGFNTNAMIITPKGAAKMLKQLQKPNWVCKHICEQQLGYLYSDPDFVCYAPIQNFIGQRGCYSELCKRYRDERWYNNFLYKDTEGKLWRTERLYEKE